jgi:putative transcription regulator
VKQGYFCADANIMLMCDIEQVVMRYVMEAKLYQKYGVRHVFHNVLLLFIRSICTEKGIALLETKINFFK